MDRFKTDMDAISTEQLGEKLGSFQVSGDHHRPPAVVCVPHPAHRLGLGEASHPADGSHHIMQWHVRRAVQEQVVGANEARRHSRVGSAGRVWCRHVALDAGEAVRGLKRWCRKTDTGYLGQYLSALQHYKTGFVGSGTDLRTKDRFCGRCNPYRANCLHPVGKSVLPAFDGMN